MSKQDTTIQPNKTNYMRSVNDYSLSAHEIFNYLTDSKFPTDTRVLTVNHITPENYVNAVGIVMSKFKEFGFTVQEHNTYTINYDDGSTPEEESQYTIYEQTFFAMKNEENMYVVAEIYRRNGQLIVLTLGQVSTKDALVSIGETLRSQYVAPKKERVFYTISHEGHGFDLDEMKITTKYDPDAVELHYNDDFKEVHETIIATIDNEKKGLILLHGIPGSGKTSYIKQLISRESSRKLIYIPPHLAGSIAAPQFISFVKNRLKSCVLVIEDAEDILRTREGYDSDRAAVSNLLNISDGILGEALNILIIATFNTDRENIDQALLRKGRLIGEYKFGTLDKNKAENLAHRLFGEEVELNLKPEEYTLANIFNLDIKQHRSKEKPKVAFGFQPVGA